MPRKVCATQAASESRGFLGQRHCPSTVNQLRQAILRSKGIDHFEEWELIEIGVAGANSPDAVFAHKNGCVRVVEQIAGKVRQPQNNLFGDVGVPLCRDKNCEAWRGEQHGNEVPRRRCAPWPSHDARVGCDAQKLIEDRPSGVPKHPVAPVGARASRGRRHEIASPHRRRRPAHWCQRRALATFHGVVQGIAVGNIDEYSAAAELR